MSVRVVATVTGHRSTTPVEVSAIAADEASALAALLRHLPPSLRITGHTADTTRGVSGRRAPRAGRRGPGT